MGNDWFLGMSHRGKASLSEVQLGRGSSRVCFIHHTSRWARAEADKRKTKAFGHTAYMGVLNPHC